MTSDFGVYKLTYEPPAYSTEPSVEMMLPGEADLHRMLETYGYFLQASGYILDGKQVGLTEEEPFEKDVVILGDK